MPERCPQERERSERHFVNKIYGTKTRPGSEPPLCDTCANATTVKGVRFGDDLLKCRAIGRVTFHVTECSSYNDMRVIDSYTLSQTAWIWMPDILRWVSPAELQRINRQKRAEGIPTVSPLSQVEDD